MLAGASKRWTGDKERSACHALCRYHAFHHTYAQCIKTMLSIRCLVNHCLAIGSMDRIPGSWEALALCTADPITDVVRSLRAAMCKNMTFLRREAWPCS